MKAITLWQPWASLIAHGFKTIETRRHNHFACLVGQRIAIHAGKSFDPSFAETAAPYLYRRGRDVLKEAEALVYARDPLALKADLPRGAVVCTALVDSARKLGGGLVDNGSALCYTVGLYGLILTDIERLDPPVPARGKQGIWEWEPSP